MTTYTVNVYGAYKADNRTLEIEAQSLNHAARDVRAMDIKSAMTITIKVKNSKRSYRAESISGWYNSHWA